VWPVRSGRAVGTIRLVGTDAEVRERGLELAKRALLEPGLVGVLDAHQVDAARVPGDVEVNGRGKHSADVQEAGRTRREPGDFGARGQVARRVAVFPVRRLRHTRSEQRVNEIPAQHALSLSGGLRGSGLPGPAGGGSAAARPERAARYFARSWTPHARPGYD